MSLPDPDAHAAIAASPASRTVPRGLTAGLLHALATGLAAGGFAGVARQGRRLGALLWHLLPGRRRMATQAIARHLDLPAPEARRVARQSFTHNARSFLELVLVDRFGFEQIGSRLEIADAELFRRFSESTRPHVITAAHLGAWELMAALLGQWHPDRPRLMVVRRNGCKAINDFIFAKRGARGAQVVDHRNAVFAVLKGLKRNGVAAFLVDHNTRRDEAVFLPFLGETAAVNMGPALLAVRAKAVVWPVSLVRKDDRYVLLLETPLDTVSLGGDRQNRVETVARFYTEAVERAVRAYPEQWFWMHKRWKTRPMRTP